MATFPKMKEKAPKMAHHNLSHYFRTPMASGPLYPIYIKYVNAGDDLQTGYESLVNTQALLSPLYGSYKLQIDTFYAPTFLYQPRLWRGASMRGNNNATMDADFPYYRLDSPQGSGNVLKKISPSHLLSYLGHGAYSSHWWLDDGQAPGEVEEFNALPLLIYLDIWRTYYAARHSKYAPYIGADGGDAANVQWDMELRELDDFFTYLPDGDPDITDILPQNYKQTLFHREYQDLGGLMLRCHLPDRMNVILNSSFYDQNVTSVTVDTTGDSFQVDQLVTAKKLWNSRNKDAMTNGTFRDWVRSHYGVTPNLMSDQPTFLGSTSSEIVFEDIRATANTQTDAGDAQYLGDKASTGKAYGNSRRHRCVADKPGFVMVLASIVPRVDYGQYEERYMRYKKLSDTFRPEFNGIGLQDVLVSDLNTSWQPYSGNKFSYTPEMDPNKVAVGKTIAWAEYQTAVNRVAGTFLNTERSWVLLRDFNGVNPVTTSNPAGLTPNIDRLPYIEPGMYSRGFADNALKAQNFLCQFYIRSHYRSTVLKRLRPKF